MPTISCRNRRITCEDGNVLTSLENAGIAVPSSCRTGHCQSCLARLLQGKLDPAAQRGLSAHQKHLNYFLTCQSYPTQDMEIELLHYRQRYPAILLEKEILNDRFIRARLQAEVDWKAGQYLTLWRSRDAGRIYSIASLPEEGFIELHLRRRNGIISGWLEQTLEAGGHCEISVPRGDCFYSPAMPLQPIVMIAFGTGLAPLFGVLKQALAEAHHGDIALYVVVDSPSHLYLTDELEQLATVHKALSVHYLVQSEDGSDAHTHTQESKVIELVQKHHQHLRGHLIYLCGSSQVVKRLRKFCFMRGADYSDIFYDVFAST